MTKEDYKSLLGNAVIFYNSARFLMDNCSKTKDSNEVVSYYVSSIVNFAFASELCMKAVLSHELISYNKIHLLKELFYLYPTNLKTEIYRLLELEPAAFNKKLDSISNVFADWRYFVFNNRNLHIDNIFLSNFCSMLFKQAISLLD